MIIQIIPARRMPLSLPFLDYSVPAEFAKKIKIGQLVKIPFRNKEEFGVILDIKSSEKANIKTKPIKEIVFAEPILSKAQLNFLVDIAEFYHVSLGFLLKGNLLPLQKTKIKKISLTDHSPLGRGRGGLAAGLPTIYNDDQPTPGLEASPAQAGNKKPIVFIHKNEEEKTKIILEQIKGGQTLILVPELTAIKKITEILPENILNRAITITSELTNKELFTKWLQIWLGEKDIVIGTRTALFLPWFNLKNIILTDEGNSNYKSWDMAPRFHTRDAALFLSKHHGAELSLLSHTLSIESYYFAKNKVYSTAHDLKIESINKTTEIVDMKSEWRGGNRSLMSTDVLDELKKNKTGDVVFFLNRRGTASYVGCADCGNVLKCPHCKLSLTYHQDKNILSCHYCHRRSGVPPHGGDQFSEPMPTVCKNCSGVNVATHGAGTQLAEELIKKITAKTNDPRPVVRIDSDENPDTRAAEAAQYGAGKIIICTQLAWPHLNWTKIKLFVFLDADAPLFIPEYKIIENLWQQIRDVQYKLAEGAGFLIQTNYPEHLVFKSLYDPDLFYSEQLAERRVLGYPPFKYMLKLLSGNQKSGIIEAEAEKIKNDLLGLTPYSSLKGDYTGLTKGIFGIKILGPLETSPYYYNGQYWQVILAKIGYENYKQNTKLLLARVPENWKIDPNPNTLLSFY